MQLTFAGCGSLDQHNIALAFQTVATYSTSAYNSVVKNEPTIMHNQWPLFTRWFGAYNKDRLARVKVVLQNVSTRLDSDHTTIHVLLDPAGNNSGLDREDYAEITINQRYPDAMAVTLGNKFITAPSRGGVSSQWGVLFHEFTHATANTDDHRYGKDNALALAIHNPDHAVDNADNYEFFLEELFPVH